MSSRIGLISDTHATLAPLAEALQIFSEQQVDTIICAGDIAGYGEDEIESTVELLQSHNCRVIAGNHDTLDEIGDQSSTITDYFKQLPLTLELDIEDCHITVIHAEPPLEQHGGIKILDPQGKPIADRLHYWEAALAPYKYDILIVGHTHQVFAQPIGNTLVINPGSTCYNHSCMILDLPARKTTTYALSGQAIIPTWNWGLFHRDLKYNK